MVELVVVQTLEYVEDKRNFSTVSFSKSKLQNILNEHMVACIGEYSHSLFKLENFSLRRFTKNDI